MSEQDPLARADARAAQQGTRALDDPSIACRAEPRHALEVRVVGEDDSPVADVGVELARAPGAVLRDRTGIDGVARFEGLAAGSYHASLYELDQDAWKQIGQAALDRPSPPVEAVWQSAPDIASTALVHTVAPGECIAQLAHHYGFAPATLWDLPANQALKASRAGMYMLYDGAQGDAADQVTIPARRKRMLAVQTGQRYELRRIGVPELLDIVFQDNGLPIANTGYMIAVLGPDAALMLQRRGRTDANGRLKEAIAPHAASATVTLAVKGKPVEYEFALGHLNPVETLVGVQSMLSNLGYPCEDEHGEMGPRTERAIAAFQRAHDLPANGLDDATRTTLRQMYSQ